ncbi:MAG TPA: MBL fold metallo-hydrolase [Cyclobacteriaceae bacterium]|nr:MBL fold metallo-hydrolase [Cyclobacteriaceae bacterium]
MLRHKLYIFFLLLAIGCAKEETSWCDKPKPSIDESLKRPQYSNDWFQVYEVQDSIFAIYEPYQWQEVISYLVIGKEFALLFDTGNGIGNIKSVVGSITSLPVRVLNSHSHFDHVGGNADFDFIYGMDTGFTRDRQKGRTHDQVADEVSPAALCRPLPDGVKAEEHHIRPYEIDEVITEGSIIDLGNRKLKVISIPGHTPDAIGLIDEENKLLWTGDTFYKGPIWLFAKETDLPAYRNSIARLAALAPSLDHVLPAHNIPLVDPKLLVDLNKALVDIENGTVKYTINKDGRRVFEFAEFSVLMANE